MGLDSYFYSTEKGCTSEYLNNSDISYEEKESPLTELYYFRKFWALHFMVTKLSETNSYCYIEITEDELETIKEECLKKVIDEYNEVKIRENDDGNQLEESDIYKIYMEEIENTKNTFFDVCTKLIPLLEMNIKVLNRRVFYYGSY